MAMGWFQRILDWLNRFKPKPPPIPVPTPPPGPILVFTEDLNAQRRDYGLPPMVEDIPLNRIAQEWADQMAATGILTHGDFLGRIYSVYPSTAASENIAEGQPDVASVVDSWMQSLGHRANILGDFNRVGWGLARDGRGVTYWVCDFCLV
jgi:uncharacterized protein YkwD